jgi:hypothetical protein
MRYINLSNDTHNSFAVVEFETLDKLNGSIEQAIKDNFDLEKVDFTPLDKDSVQYLGRGSKILLLAYDDDEREEITLEETFLY